MSTRSKPERADEPLRWLRANGHDLAPLTGTDTQALLAIAACWRLYATTHNEDVLTAVESLLGVMQRSMAPLARELIAWALDWSDRDRLWPIVWGDA